MDIYDFLVNKINYYYRVVDTIEGDGLYDRIMDDIEDAHEDGDVTETEYYLLLEML